MKPTTTTLDETLSVTDSESAADISQAQSKTGTFIRDTGRFMAMALITQGAIILAKAAWDVATKKSRLEKEAAAKAAAEAEREKNEDRFVSKFGVEVRTQLGNQASITASVANLAHTVADVADLVNQIKVGQDQLPGKLRDEVVSALKVVAEKGQVAIAA
jgi:ribosomal protein S11